MLVCPRCKLPLRLAEVPVFVQLGMKLITIGAFVFLVVPLVVIAGLWLEASSTTWSVLEGAIYAGSSAALSLVGYLIQRVNQRPLYVCDSCHRRFNWRAIAAMRSAGHKVEANVQSNNTLERTVMHSGPRPVAARSSSLAAQLGR